MARTITVLGIDIAKLVFHVVGMDDSGHVVLLKRIARIDSWRLDVASNKIYQ